MGVADRATCHLGNTGAHRARLAEGLNEPIIDGAGDFPAVTRRKALTPQHGVAANRKAALKLVTDDDQSTIAGRHADGETEDGERSGAAPARLEGLSPEERSREILNLILTELDDDKAEDVVTIPLAGKAEDLLRETGTMAAVGLEASRKVFSRPWPLAEFLDQLWFLAKVTTVPVILISIPFGMVISLQVGSLTTSIVVVPRLVRLAVELIRMLMPTSDVTAIAAAM